MRAKIRSLWEHEAYKRVLKNIFFLFILKGSEYLLPLILLPFLVRTLGVELFGLLALATSTVFVFRGVVAYGFDMTGTHQIAIHREDKEKVEEIFSSIIIAKLILMAGTSVLFAAVVYSFEMFYVHWEVYTITYLLVVGDVLFPQWFFQGMENMKFITNLRIAYKTLYILMVFAFVYSSEDYLWVPFLEAVSALAAGLVSLWFIYRNFGVGFKLQPIASVKNQFVESWHVFISNMAVIFYSSANIIFLGVFLNEAAVGYFSIAKRLIDAIRGIFGPLNTAIFPFLSKQYLEDRAKYYSLAFKYFLFNSLGLLVFALAVFLFSGSLIELVSGQSMEASKTVLQILALGLVFSMGTFFSSMLIIKKKSRVLSKITWMTMGFNLLFLYPVVAWYGIVGMAWLFVAVQVFHLYLQLFYNAEIFKRPKNA